MPKLSKSFLKGKSLSQLKTILENIIDDGTYRAKDIEKVRTKITKRLTQGDKLVDDAMLNDLFEGMNLN